MELLVGLVIGGMGGWVARAASVRWRFERRMNAAERRLRERGEWKVRGLRSC